MHIFFRFSNYDNNRKNRLRDIIKNSIFMVILIYFFITLNCLECLNKLSACDLPFEGTVYNAYDIENKNFNIDISRTYNQNEIFKIKSMVSKCKIQISNNIRNKQDQIFRLNNDKAKIIGSQNIKDLISRIKTLNKELKDIQKPLENEFNKIPYMGIYAALLEADNNTRKDEFITAAKQQIAEYAIQNVKTEISSHYILKNNQVIMDKIESKSSGEMEINEKLDDAITFSSNKIQFFYVAVVNIFPLKKNIKKQHQKDIDLTSYVENLLDGEVSLWFKNKIKDLMGDNTAYAKNQILNDAINIWVETIQMNNEKSINDQKRSIEKIDQLIKSKKREINEAENKLYKARSGLKTIYKSLKIKCSQNPEFCLDNAIKKMDSQITQIVKQCINEKEKEKVLDDDIVHYSNDPKLDTKHIIESLYKNIKEEYCKREQLLQMSRVEKGYLVQHDQKKGYYITKKPDKINVYPYIKNRKLNVLLVMGFNIQESDQIDNYDNSFSGSIITYNDVITNSIGMKFVKIKSGSFMMGSPDNESYRESNEKQHNVTLTNDYYLQTTEVTQGQWKEIMGNNPSRFKNCGNDCPVESVSWEDVQKFIDKLNRKEGINKYRLPTEAEWEYAARAGSKKAFSNGDISEETCGYDSNLDKVGWYCGNSCVNYSGGWSCSYCKGKCNAGTHPVGKKQKNSWGLYDMHGNVWEWCQDWYDDYKTGNVDNPTGPSSGSYRVIRGGAWSISARFCRSAYRYYYSPGLSYDSVGFRLFRTP